MAENGGGGSSAPASAAAASSLSTRPTLTLPPRSSMESLFSGNFGVSPGPMTLVSSFFATDDPDSECRSFSQLLAGAMASPAAAQRPPHLPPTSSAAADHSREEQLGGCGGDDFRLKQNRPSGLEISQPLVFTVPPGLSPGSFLDSPGFFSGLQSPFGMSHQQALAQVTAQAHYMQMHSSSGVAAASTSQVQPSTSNKTSHEQMLHLTSDSTAMVKESSEIPQSDQRIQPLQYTVDKPADDGYNWRKYGQKHVKGSEYPRSYYKCSHPACPVKKKVEHSIDGHVTEIIYKGQHCHPPPSNKRSKDDGNQSGNSNYQANLGLVSKVQTANVSNMKEEVAASLVSKIDCVSNQASPEHLSRSSGSEEVADNETNVEEKDEDEPDSKRRNLEGRIAEPVSSHRTVTEPKIIVQTTSEVDLLDDGYRWRKYGQKVVKGNPYPRSYYKCTYTGCNVRKHVERAAADPRAVITAYEGKHNHDVPLGKGNIRNTANSNGSQPKAQSLVARNHDPIDKSRDTGNHDQQPVALLQLKEEHPT